MTVHADFDGNGNLIHAHIDVDPKMKVETYGKQLEALKKTVKNACIKVEQLEKFSYDVGVDVGKFIGKLEAGRAFEYEFINSAALNQGRALASNEFCREVRIESRRPMILSVSEGVCKPIELLRT